MAAEPGRTSLRVACIMDMAACPMIRGSASYLRPRQVEWSASSQSRALGGAPTAYVTGWMRDDDRWARGGAGFVEGPGDRWHDPAPDWLPRPPDGWLDSLQAVQP